MYPPSSGADAPLIAQHKNAEAEDKLADFVATKDPTAVPVYALLIESYLMSGGKDKLPALMDQAVKANPKSAELLARRAMCYLLATTGNDPRRGEKARADLEEADALQPDQAEVRLMLAELWLHPQVVNLARAKAEVEAAQKLPLSPDAIFDFEREGAKLALLNVAAKVALRSDDRTGALALADQGLKELTEGRLTQFLPLVVQLYLRAAIPDKADLSAADASRRDELMAKVRKCLKQYHEAIVDAARSNRELSEQLALLDAQLSNAESRPYDALARLQEVLSVGNAENPQVWRELGYSYPAARGRTNSPPMPSRSI